jgi:hypothetical protein
MFQMVSLKSNMIDITRTYIHLTAYTNAYILYISACPLHGQHNLHRSSTKHHKQIHQDLSENKTNPKATIQVRVHQARFQPPLHAASLPDEPMVPPLAIDCLKIPLQHTSYHLLR